MPAEPAIAEAYELAEEIESLWKAGSDSCDAKNRYIGLLRWNKAALEPLLPGERDLFYAFRLERDDIRRLSDCDLQYDLAGIRFTSAPLEVLEMSCLEKLDLYSSDISPADRKKLKEALPKTKILLGPL
jgi:hypothetical protein